MVVGPPPLPGGGGGGGAPADWVAADLLLPPPPLLLLLLPLPLPGVLLWPLTPLPLPRLLLRPLTPLTLPRLLLWPRHGAAVCGSGAKCVWGPWQSSRRRQVRLPQRCPPRRASLPTSELPPAFPTRLRACRPPCWTSSAKPRWRRARPAASRR